MDQNTVVLIEKLASAVGKTGSDIVHHYATWYIASSIVWGCLGAIIVSLGFMVKGGEDGELFGIPAVAVKALIVLVGVVLLCCNMPDLIAPHGIAIHQLIKDLR